MNIRRVSENKKDYLDLLLLADEQESMIDRYLARGDMFVLELEDGAIVAQCVVTREDKGVYELKSIAVMPEHQRKGFGRMLIEFTFAYYDDCRVMLVGTGEVPSSLGFYTRCGFTISYRVKNFFTDNYDHCMYEDGIQLVDMIYLKRERL